MKDEAMKEFLPGSDVVVVTGANGGIGKALTELFVREGKQVVMACRNLKKGEKVRNEIVSVRGSKPVLLLPLDLVSDESIDLFTKELERRRLHLSCLVNNAGIMSSSFQTTKEGMELDMAINYRGTARLIYALLPLMSRGSVIVNTVSLMWRFGNRKVLYGNFSSGKHYIRLKAYADSKLVLFVYTAWLSKQLQEQGISVHAVDPGIVNTGMITMNCWFDPLTNLFFRPFIRSSYEGAIPVLKASRITGETGLLFKGTGCKYFPLRIQRLAEGFVPVGL